MDGFLRVDTNSTLAISPSSSYLADEVASICPLITPSPPTNDLINPPLEPTEATFTIGDELATKLQHVQGKNFKLLTCVDVLLFFTNIIFTYSIILQIFDFLFIYKFILEIVSICR